MTGFSQSISEEAKQAIRTESRVLDEVLSSLESQRREGTDRLTLESERARELTSAIVSTRREEDKALLASDEAVAHGLKDKKGLEIAVIDRLLKQPYFARVVVEEETPQGLKQFEYKLGFSENSDCRIVDWRKAPIAKLYYEYKEGDEYCEQIRERERIGKVLMRNQLEIQDSKLKKISCRYGNFACGETEWTQLQSPLRSRTMAGSSESGSTERSLPHIASLMTPEQFDLIAKSGDAAMLIQGIAGSGKTTVALHRLAWLLGNPQNLPTEKEASALGPDRCLVIVLSRSLQQYLENTLPSMGVRDVRIITLVNWLSENLALILPHLVRKEEDGIRVRRPSDRVPASIERLKKSMAMLTAVERVGLSIRNKKHAPLEDMIIELLGNPKAILDADETRLLDKEIIASARERSLKNKAEGVLDVCDDSLFVRLYEIVSGHVFFKNGESGLYQHIVADEVQDFSPIDLACVFGAVEDTRGITMVGDIAQKIDTSHSFPGWDSLRKHWAFRETIPRFINLNLSHRSTQQILKLADFVQQRKTPSQGREGRTPIWFKCDTETLGIKAAIDWISRAMERYPTSLSAIMCRNPAEMKYVYQMLRPTFGERVRIGDDKMFSFTEGIVVTCAEQVKGLEFTNTLLWNPSKKDYPKDDLHRNLLYTAMTRAEENLCIVTWHRPSELLPGINSPLIRVHIINEEVQDAI